MGMKKFSSRQYFLIVQGLRDGRSAKDIGVTVDLTAEQVRSCARTLRSKREVPPSYNKGRGRPWNDNDLTVMTERYFAGGRPAVIDCATTLRRTRAAMHVYLYFLAQTDQWPPKPPVPEEQELPLGCEASPIPPGMWFEDAVVNDCPGYPVYKPIRTPQYSSASSSLYGGRFVNMSGKQGAVV